MTSQLQIELNKANARRINEMLKALPKETPTKVFDEIFNQPIK